MCSGLSLKAGNYGQSLKEVVPKSAASVENQPPQYNHNFFLTLRIEKTVENRKRKPSSHMKISQILLCKKIEDLIIV